MSYIRFTFSLLVCSAFIFMLSAWSYDTIYWFEPIEVWDSSLYVFLAMSTAVTVVAYWVIAGLTTHLIADLTFLIPTLYWVFTL